MDALKNTGDHNIPGPAMGGYSLVATRARLGSWEVKISIKSAVAVNGPV